MCGRFTLTASAEVVADFFELADPPALSPRFNIAPTQPAPAVLLDRTSNERRFRSLRWGLIPSWAKEPGIGARMINARAETVAVKPAYRSAFRRRRCLIVADGFYEWSKVTGTKKKQPHYVRVGDGGPFAMAGLWEHWEGAGAAPVDSCTIITTEPNELMRALHDRMPAILPRESFARWLDPRFDAPDALVGMLRAYPSEEMTAYPVDTRVNSPSFDGPECIQPLAL